MRVNVNELKTFDSNEKVLIDIGDKKDIEIDILLVDLIEKLNNNGFKTEYCCSGHEDEAYTTFYIRFGKLDKYHIEIMSIIVDMIEGIFCEMCPNYMDYIDYFYPLTNEGIEIAREDAIKDNNYEITIRLELISEVEKLNLEEEFEPYKAANTERNLLKIYKMILDFEKVIDLYSIIKSEFSDDMKVKKEFIYCTRILEI